MDMVMDFGCNLEQLNKNMETCICISCMRDPPAVSVTLPEGFVDKRSVSSRDVT